MDATKHFLRAFPEAIRESGDEYRMTCINPSCEDRTKKSKKKLYVNLRKKVYNCFRCGYTGHLYALIAMKEGLSFAEVKEICEEEKSYINDGLCDDYFTKIINNVFPKEEMKPQKKYNVQLPKEMVPAWESRHAMDYLVNTRKMDENTIKLYRLGFCYTGEYSYRVIVPFFENNELIYFLGRSIFDFHVNKYKNPTGIDFPGKSQVLFNTDYIDMKKYDYLILVEGVFDAIRMGQNCVAILGKSLSREQSFRIRKYAPKKIFVVLDKDAYEEGLEICRDFYGSSNIEAYPVVLDSKDPDLVGRDAVFSCINKTQVYNYRDFVVSRF